MSRSYTFTAKRITIWDGSASTSLKRKKRSKLPLLRKRRKIIPPTTELPVTMTTAVSINQKRMPQAGIQSCLSQKTNWPCQEETLAGSTAKVPTS